MIDREHDLPITKQAEVLEISRGSVYYLPRPVPCADLAIMRRLDQLHLEFPSGLRMLRGLLAAEGCKIGRRHFKTLMRRMGIEALRRSICGPTKAAVNRRRPHSSLDGSTPDQAYFTPLPLRSLTPADAPLIDAEILFRQPGPAQ
jgi:hypothetical protein